VILFAALAAVGTIGGISYLLFFSAETRLTASQIEVTGAHYVSSGEIAGVFTPDLGRSVFRVPLGKRLAAIEAMPWVRSAAVERLLPNRLNVSIVERQPVAFLNTNSGMKLIDAEGVILDLPSGARFNLPVVTGPDETVPAAERARRLGMK
jgi:cell division protein FtsQ